MNRRTGVLPKPHSQSHAWGWLKASMVGNPFQILQGILKGLQAAQFCCPLWNRAQGPKEITWALRICI